MGFWAWSKKRRVWTVVLIAVPILTVVAFELIVPGFSVARREPSRVEVAVATWVLHQSVPDEAKRAVNPLGANPDPAEITEGRDTFRAKCELCHAYDGGGKTEIGAGEYPRPPALRSMNVASMSDGEFFYHIPQRHPEHGHARVVDARSRRLADGRVHPHVAERGAARI